jgi:hypothetical protein
LAGSGVEAVAIGKSRTLSHPSNMGETLDLMG